ncbi:L,D-transpeptidase catalytic domain [Roseicitreum antarcticum]|uniref:L,D-transpeptidase catalytic domain n=1 Tax=Roseicitreum antarcticum TaxID=564137 RepID=A0A1H2X2B1_9RHOB|nr:L,D-transpeptidase family protein [Roseicitreum antarcticum]SDW86927.1 L,D-transpeptidase catalytic domain [Roseicitreum antarcticum]
MQFWRVILMFGLMGALASCSQSRFRTYDGPEVTEIRIYKAERQMELMHHDRVLRSFRVGLGRDPIGHKTTRGDGRTPEGRYVIDRRNPESAFHLSIGMSYPNAADLAQAAERGVDAGGDIFIHGWGPRFQRARGDWTDGCIAVSDREMEDIYAMVRNGTPIEVFAARPVPEIDKDHPPMALPVPVPGAVMGPVTGPAPTAMPVYPLEAVPMPMTTPPAGAGVVPMPLPALVPARAVAPMARPAPR